MQAIRAHKDSHKQYTERLLAEGNIKKEQLDKINDNVHNILQKAFEEAKASFQFLDSTVFEGGLLESLSR